MSQSLNQIAKAAGNAFDTCPKTSWSPQPCYDYTGQRLAFETMRSQLLDDLSRAQAKLHVMVIQWGLLGNWPKFRNQPVYFLNEILAWTSSSLERHPPDDDFPQAGPPWEAKHVARFFDRTVIYWGHVQCDIWARELVSEWFDLQESNFAQDHPLE